jgi:hypothetical protein
MTAQTATRFVFAAFFLVACAITFAGCAAAASPPPLPRFAGVTPATAIGTPLLAMPAVAVPKGTLERVKAKLKEMNPFAEGKEAEVEALFESEFTEQDAAPKPPVQPNQPSGDLAAQVTAAVQAAVAPLQQQVDGLTEALTTEKQARETAQKALADKQAKDREAAITKALDEAVKAGKIETAKRETWQKRLEADFETISEVLSERPGDPALAKSQGQKAGEAAKPTAPAAPQAPTQEAHQATRQAALSAFRTTSAQA